jgi:hypothetical protein
VDSLGLICGAAQTGFTAGRTLGKRKRPRDVTAGWTIGQRKLDSGRTLERWSLRKKWRPGAGAATSSAASQGALAAARAGVNPAIYDQYTGRYSGSHYMTIRREGDRLYVEQLQSSAPRKFELIPQSETDFSVHSTEATIRFNKNGDGRVVSLSIMSPTVDSAALYWREGEQPIVNPF